MNNNEQHIEKLKAEQEARIQRSKIYGDGTTSIPQGIVDILFIDSESGVITKFTGTEGTKGRILILLPFRTPRNLGKFASYSQPADWKLRFSRGMMVNAVIENGYVKKLIPSYQYMPAAEIITPEEIEDKSPFNPEEEQDKPAVKRDFEKRVEAFENESQAKEPLVPAGFEDTDDNPF
ncbi:hypothetical protein KUV23_06060 [Algoriphagus marincola]|uniref:PRC-barrel domain-containing protein n=1 Tax=Algoriphagus marincola TaxID=264027 RepID=A0ABS7N3Q0_9BACT|nr:hypothetical protein [Algoriphagus marincola]MBY5950528.1 hypothetical protein [Algoriphagus marincola]